MRFFGPLLFTLSFPLFAATTYNTQIHDVDFGKEMGEEVYVYLKSGHVAKLRTWDQELIDKFHEAKTQDDWFEITLDDDRYIVDVRPGHALLSPPSIKNFSHQDDGPYIPTTIESMAKARKYFRESPYNPKESQCFNRAMVWTYEWWKHHSLKAGKALIFFTRNYIRKYDFEWWFHITPYVHIMDGDKVVERTMDVKYTSGPLEFRKWTNIFMRNDAECPIITKFSEYADFPYSGDCFLIRTHMYTYQPADLQMYEAWGYKKDSFHMDEVKAAYLEAFDINL